MKTAEAARAAGVKISTIRFYEREGLIAAQTRSSAGYRQFTDEDIRRLKFVKRAQELGFSLAEINKFMAFSNQRVPQNSDILLVGREKLGDLDRRIQALTRMRSALDELLSNVCDISESAECPIIHSLADFD